jgi:hypothetical protein
MYSLKQSLLLGLRKKKFRNTDLQEDYDVALCDSAAEQSLYIPKKIKSKNSKMAARGRKQKVCLL